MNALPLVEYNLFLAAEDLHAVSAVGITSILRGIKRGPRNVLELLYMSLWRRLDWVAKRFLLELWEKEEEATTAWGLYSLDMAYHNLNPNDGLYYYLAQRGEMERIVSDVAIVHAAHQPPADTRAYARGKVVQWIEERGNTRALCTNSWDQLKIVNAADRGYKRVQRTRNPHRYISLPMPDPRETYAHLVEKVKKELARG